MSDTPNTHRDYLSPGKRSNLRGHAYLMVKSLPTRILLDHADYMDSELECVRHQLTFTGQQRDSWEEGCERAEAELERVRPVVEAALAYRSPKFLSGIGLQNAETAYLIGIAGAVDAYRAVLSEQEGNA